MKRIDVLNVHSQTMSAPLEIPTPVSPPPTPAPVVEKPLGIIAGFSQGRRRTEAVCHMISLSWDQT